MINQFTEGLNSCGNLWDIVKINWIDFLPIFTKTNERLSRASFRALFEISWSAEGSKRREDEEETIYYWELVLKMIEGERHLLMIPLMFFLVIYLESEHSQHTRARGISESRKWYDVILVPSCHMRIVHCHSLLFIASLVTTPNCANQIQYNKPCLHDFSIDKETELRFEELLVFITATDEVPVLGFPEKLSIHFYQPEKRGFRLPYTSTCMMGLFLPRGVKSHAELNTMLLRAVRDSNGFGKS